MRVLVSLRVSVSIHFAPLLLPCFTWQVGCAAVTHSWTHLLHIDAGFGTGFQKLNPIIYSQLKHKTEMGSSEKGTVFHPFPIFSHDFGNMVLWGSPANSHAPPLHCRSRLYWQWQSLRCVSLDFVHFIPRNARRPLLQLSRTTRWTLTSESVVKHQSQYLIVVWYECLALVLLKWEPTFSPRSLDTCLLSFMSHLFPRTIFSTSEDACYTHIHTYTDVVLWHIFWNKMNTNKCLKPVLSEPSFTSSFSNSWQTGCEWWKLNRVSTLTPLS